MKKILWILILIFSFFTANSFAETKIKYKTYNKLPCKFNGARVTATAQPNSWLPAITGGPCTTGKDMQEKWEHLLKLKEVHQFLQLWTWS